MTTITKTSYFLSGLLGGVCALSSCSQEENPAVVPDGCDRRIVFHTVLPEISTRANEIVTDLSEFSLTVFDESESDKVKDGILEEFYDCLDMVKEAGSQSVISDDCIWPDPEKESHFLHFFAWYPAVPKDNIVNNTSASGESVTVDYGIKGFTVAPDIADEVDFVTAYATGSMADNLFSGVDLSFRHNLSRIEVKAMGAHKSCDIEVAGVAIGEVLTQGDFEFPKTDADAVWSNTLKGNVSYIYRPGDVIVTVGSEAVSIMGSKVDEDNDNCAMVIPSASALASWDYAGDIHNERKGLYLNVLLRVLDKTPGGNGRQQYPYFDNSQGLNALSIPRVFLTVGTDGKVIENPGVLYKDDSGIYYVDEELTLPYVAPEGGAVREFGWAALPITGNWQAGKVYTYTLDYTYGVGVHGPEVEGDIAPKAGDPIISDRVGVTLSFKNWQTETPTGVTVPGN